MAGATLHDACLALALVADEAEFELRLAHGGIWRNKWRVLEPATPMVVADLLTVHLPPGNHYPAITLGPDDVLYEDPALIVLNKPPGVYVSVTPWDLHGNVLAAMQRWLTERDGTPPQLHLAHQLDRDTSGVLVLTKDPRANGPLQRAFSEHRLLKRYWAMAAGVPAMPRWSMATGHGRGAHGLFRLYPLEQVGQALPLGKERIKLMTTDFELLEHWASTSLIEAQPRTGRTHQIRLHLQSAGHPVLGDARYGGPLMIAELPLHHHLLHAQNLALRHPLTNELLDLAAPLPSLWQAALALVRTQAGSN